MTSPDPELLAAIQQIRVIDHHSHALPARKPDPNEAERPDPLGKTPFPYPVRLRVTNPEYIEAWRALYGYKYADMMNDHSHEVLTLALTRMIRAGQITRSRAEELAGLVLRDNAAKLYGLGH